MGSIFRHGKATLPVPDDFSAADVKIEASVCTGERTIGFYSASDRRLHYAEVVRSDADIDAFLRKYGIHQAKGSEKY